jgi:hypothetical protein
LKIERYALICILILAAAVTIADNPEKSDRFLCSTSTIQDCFEDDVCNETFPWEANVPQFLVVDTKKMTLSTAKAIE